MSRHQRSPGGGSLDAMAVRKLAALERRGLRRRVSAGDRRDGMVIERGGRRLLSFCCNDYLNLAQHPGVCGAAAAAVYEHGAGAGASRLVTGNHALLPALEQRLAALKETPDAVVFGSGYLANLGIIPTVVGAGDLVLADALAHACLLAGARLSGARLLTFRHNDLTDLERLLHAHRGSHRRCLVLTEGVFSMDGDLAPLPPLSQLVRQYDAWLLVDDAHGLGVVGAGRGSRFACEPLPDIDLQMGTLSKAAGAYGGYLCASTPVAELMRSRARTLVYTTGLPPSAAAAAAAALEIIGAEPERCARPLRQAGLFCRLLGLPPPQSPIVPLRLGGARRALEASQYLESAGFLVTAIRPPTVPRGTARLRFTFTAGHRDEDVRRLVHALRRGGYAPPAQGAGADVEGVR